MGANLEVWSNRDSGTEIQLSIPASVAYRSSRKLGSLWSSRRANATRIVKCVLLRIKDGERIYEREYSNTGGR